MEVARGSSPLYVTCRAPPFPPRIQRVCLWYIFSSKPQARIQLTSGQQPLLMPLKNNPEQKKTTSSWNTMCMTHRYVNIIKNQRKKHQETHIISIYIKSVISLTLLRPFHEKKKHTKTADSHSIACKTKHSWTVSVILLYALANIKHGLNTSPSFQQHQVIVFDSIKALEIFFFFSSVRSNSCLIMSIPTQVLLSDTLYRIIPRGNL